MIKSNVGWVVEEDEIVYWEYGEMVDKNLKPSAQKVA